MHSFLSAQKINHEIFIINQVDDYRFNRASLINAGFQVARKHAHFDYIVMHDVDLLPVNQELRYEYPGRGSALHIASPKLHPKYHYENFVGGILALTVEDFELVDGLSNRYWGWGLEDDEFYLRMKQGGIEIIRPQGITTGVTDTFRHIHDTAKQYRKRDTAKCFDQKAVTRKRDRVTGLHDVDYRLHSTTSMTVDGSLPVRIVNVVLMCNHTATPWCHCENPQKSPGRSQSPRAKDKH